MKHWSHYLLAVALAAAALVPCLVWAEQRSMRDAIREERSNREPIGSVSWPTQWENARGMRITLAVQRLPGEDDDAYAKRVRPLVGSFVRVFPIEETGR